MTGILEVTVKVYLNSDVEGASAEAREIAQAVVGGARHVNIASAELVQYQPYDAAPASPLTDEQIAWLKLRQQLQRLAKEMREYAWLSRFRNAARANDPGTAQSPFVARAISRGVDRLLDLIAPQEEEEK